MLIMVYQLAQLLSASIDALGGKPQKISREDWQIFLAAKTRANKIMQQYKANTKRAYKQGLLDGETPDEHIESIMDANSVLYQTITELAGIHTDLGRAHVLALIRAYKAGEVRIED